MKKKIAVVIGASQDAIHTIQSAKDAGVHVIALDGNPNADGLRYADESVVVDISKKEDVCQQVERIKPDFVLPVPIGRYLSTTGYVNDRFRLKGISYVATKLSTDKYLFHQKLQKENLRNIQLHLVNKETEFEKLRIPYPAIMKPRFGSGSRDVFYVTNDVEGRVAFQKINHTSEDFVLEEVVQGEEYGVDGAVINGKLQITLLRKKLLTPLPIRQAIGYFSVPKIGEENQKLWMVVTEYLRKVVGVLEYDNCLIHADIIVNEKGAFVIEIAPRPSGHNLHSVFVPECTGIDIAKEYISFLMEKECEFEVGNIPCMLIRFFDFENGVACKVPQLEGLQRSGVCNVKRWDCRIKVGDRMEKVVDGHSIVGRGFFVIEGQDEADLLRQSEWILKQFECSEKDFE